MKKNIILVAIIIILIGIMTIMIIDNNKKEKCSSITGGSYNLIFNTNSDQEIETMNICIACNPYTYKDIPKGEKEGYKFEGWYYDKELTKKVEVKNTKDISPIPKKKDGCTIGYKDINIYAKYIEE